MEHRLVRYFPVITCVACSFLLVGVGFVCLYSALRGSLVVPADLVHKQAVILILALVMGIGTVFVKEEWLHRVAQLGMILAVLGLVAVLIPGLGVKVNGARRWLDLGVTQFQISELAKVLMVIGLAHYLSVMQRFKRELVRGGVVPLSIIAVFFGLLILEPDFGTAALFGIVGVTMLYLWGTPLWLLGLVGVSGCGGFLALVFRDPVRLKRLTSFIDIEGNKADGAYQLNQGLLAFGAGGWTGSGLGNGRQQLAYLPEAHTDFIFPVVGEELGLVGTLSVAMLFVGLFWAIVQMARQVTNMFWFLIVVGAGSFLVFQALFNMGVVTGLLPTKGISLPFISYGGSNLVSSFLLIGLLVAAWRHRFESPIKRVREL